MRERDRLPGMVGGGNGGGGQWAGVEWATVLCLLFSISLFRFVSFRQWVDGVDGFVGLWGCGVRVYHRAKKEIYRLDDKS